LIAPLLKCARSSDPRRNRPGRKDKAEAMKYYKPDLARLRPGVQMGGGRIKERKMEVSVGCAKFLQAMKTKMGS
jgi:hypothetical protein